MQVFTGNFYRFPVRLWQSDSMDKVYPRSNKFMGPFATKKYNMGSDSHLARVLGLSDVVSFGVSSTIGSGIFVSIGYIARYITGPSLFLTFLLVVSTVLLSGFCFAEFAGVVHSAGMGYSYAYTTYGELVAFIIGSLTFLSYCLGTAAVARGWADYLNCFVYAASGYEIPAVFSEYKVNDFINISILAPLLCLAGSYIAISGIRESAWVGKMFVTINLSIMAGFVIYGLLVHGDAQNLSPLFLPEVGWIGILKGSGLAFFCLIGWDLTCSLSDEVVEPKRTLPRGIVATLLLVGLVYCSVSLTLCAMVPSDTIDIAAPIAVAFRTLGDNRMYLLVSFAAVTVTSANVLTGSTGPPRILYTMANDGLLPSGLGRVDPRSGVPRSATIVCAIMNIIACTCFDFTSLASITSCSSLIVYAVVCGGLLILRLEKTSITSRYSLMGGLVLFLVSSLTFQFHLLGLEQYSRFSLYYLVANICSGCVLAPLYWSGSRSRMLSDSLLLGDDEPLKSSGFKCPWVPLVPLLAMWVNSFMIATLGLTTLLGALAVVGLCSFTYLIMHH